MTEEIPTNAVKARPSSSMLGAAVGSKFWPDGTARTFPGNTVVSLVAAGSAEATLLERVMDYLRDPISKNYSLLPSTSWHMTVFELVCDQVRDQDYWSTFLDTGVDLETTDDFFTERFSTVPAPASLKMRYGGIAVGDIAIGILVEPSDDATFDALDLYRERLSKVTGVRFPDHDKYKFHITLAYTIRRPTPELRAEIEAAFSAADEMLFGEEFTLDRPVLTYFSDMTNFSTTYPRTPPPARHDVIHHR